MGALKAETLNEALDQAAMEIARCDYSGRKWTKDKQVIADSFTRRVYTDSVGALIDEACGVVWVVCMESGKSWCWRVN